MEFKVLFYIIIGVIFVVSKIYQGLKKAKEEQEQRQRENAQRQANPYPTQQPAPRTDTIPDPWQENKPAPPQRRTDQSRPVAPTRTAQPAPKQKSIEEVLQDMMRQYEAPQPAPPKPARKQQPLDSPYSRIDQPTPEVAKNYKFDDSMVTGALSQKSYSNILEEDDVLGKQESLYENFNPREAFKYSILLERRYS